MPRISKAAEAAAAQYALDFLKTVKVDANSRKVRDRVAILAGRLGTKADYGSRIAVTEKAQRILNRLSRAVREGRLEADLRDVAKVREIAGEALAERSAELMFNNQLRTAYNAGRYRYQQTDKTRPFLLYRTMRDAAVRPGHRLLEGILLPVGHEFWKQHYPPNGHGCRCRVDALTERQAADLVRRSSKVRTEAPVEREIEYIDKVTGKAIKTPESIDPGWATTPEDTARAMGEVLERQLARLKKWEWPKPNQ